MQMLPIGESRKGEPFILRPYQEEAVQTGVNFLSRKGGVNEVIMAPTGCHARGSLILMADGSHRKVEDVLSGDLLESPTGRKPRRVLALCRGREMMYRLTIDVFGLYEHVVNKSHILVLTTSPDTPEKGRLPKVFMSVGDYYALPDSDRRKYYAIKNFGGGLPLPIEIDELEEDDYYGFTLDGDHLYMTSDGIVHHNSGKSLIISGTCERFSDERILVLQPSQEILKQNYAKFVATGSQAGIYSASVGRKDMARVTFASVQTVMSKNRAGIYSNAQFFTDFRHIIVDEAHLGMNANGSQAVDLFDMIAARTGHQPKVLGLTATTFRLYPCTDRHGNKDSMLKMLTRTRPRIFGNISYWIQIKPLIEQGFLATPKYYDVRGELSHGFDRSKILVNSTGADYDEKSLQMYFDTIDFKKDIVKIIQRVNKAGRQVLVFMGSVPDAEWVSSQLPDCATVTGNTPKAERARIEADFKSGKLRSVCNCSVFQVGFDYPALKAVLLAKPVRSLAVYYQAMGRALRPYNNEEAWLIDACSNLSVFGRIEDLELSHDDRNLPILLGSNGKLLTGVPLKEQEVYVADQTSIPSAKKPETAYEAMMRKAREHAMVTV
jgi:DNA repair protein RadD